MDKYKDWKKKNEATSQPVTKEQPVEEQDEPTEDEKLFYKGAYNGVVGPLLTRLSGVILTDSRFNRPAIKGLLLQDIVLALGLNQDIGLFTRITNRIRTTLNSAENPAAMPFSSPALRKALDKRGLTPTDLNKNPAPAPTPTPPSPPV